MAVSITSELGRARKEKRTAYDRWFSWEDGFLLKRIFKKRRVANAAPTNHLRHSYHGTRFQTVDVIGISLLGWNSDSNPYIEEAAAAKAVYLNCWCQRALQRSPLFVIAESSPTYW
jgi:hypothetical protein